MKFVLVHGFNVKNKGATTVDKLAGFITGAGHEVDVDEGDYGYFNLFMIRLFNRKRRNEVLIRLAGAFANCDVIVTHSNGAHFTTEALKLLPSSYSNTKVVVHISPALNSNTHIPEAVKVQLVMHTPHDGWVRLSSFLPLHPWGRMGARGYTGMDIRNTNIENHDVYRHSGWFRKQHVRKTWQTIKTFITGNES